MNCANHPETPVVSYCQFCGKPLCSLCLHKVNNIVSCEPCLAARVQSATAGTYSTPPGPLPPGTIEPPASWGTQPWVAFILGWIPGVGAMYNGQLAKALAHVVIFALLVSLSHYNGVLGLLVAAWIVYQVFDAYQTTIARRDGLPLPNPLGLNDVAQWFGSKQYLTTNPWFNNSGNPNVSNGNPNPSHPEATVPSQSEEIGGASEAGFGPTSGYASPYTVPSAPPTPPNLAGPPWLCRGNRGIPTGAVVLIALGVLFLLGNLGILSDHWLGRGWPILLIAFGVWLVFQRSQNPPSGDVR